MNIAIAGASGFIGKNLLKSLVGSGLNLKCLSRNAKRPNLNEENIQWVQSDLFSFQSINNTLKDVDVAIYLVHSMLPSERLFQGNFQDTDLFLADNFASACKENNVKQIIYLGGLVPEKKSSKHLDSRKEVEEVLKNTQIPVTILRAGMVVGDGGSSFEILKNLAINLPLMILPRWTSSLTQTIYIQDLVRVIQFSIGNNNFSDKTINVVNGEKLTYKDLITQSCEYFSQSKPYITVPINYISLSKWWVKVFGQSDFELVSPLIESLKCDLPMPNIPNEITHLIEFTSFRKMLEKIPKNKNIKNKRSKSKEGNTVRSIQRLTSANLNVEDVSDLYMTWLPQHMRNLIRVELKGQDLDFKLIGTDINLLKLHRQDERSELDRVKFHIVGGLLSKSSDTGWLEFRKVTGGHILASINNFTPSLPWYIYKYSQAQIHLKVMNNFSRYLSKEFTGKEN